MHLYTDARKSGWSWARRDENEQGGDRWSLEEAGLHVLELKAVYHFVLSVKKIPIFTYKSCQIIQPQ